MHERHGWIGGQRRRLRPGTGTGGDTDTRGRAGPGDPGGLEDPERGDVPGWVLVTLMTAGLVLALWAVAGPALTDVFESALTRVTSFGGLAADGQGSGRRPLGRPAPRSARPERSARPPR